MTEPFDRLPLPYNAQHIDGVARSLLAVVAGANTVRRVGAAVGVSSPRTASMKVAHLRRYGLIVGQDRDPDGDRHTGSIAPAVRVVAGVSPVSGRWMVEVDR